MKYCDLTLPSPEGNLACDEALLELAEQGFADDLLRVWEPQQHFVVIGYGNKIATEVALPSCRRNNIPVLRRCTGGGTVLQGPGCLNYSLILRITESGPVHSIPSTNSYILKRHQAALADTLQTDVEIRGHTDLAIRGLKFSGNAQRRKRRFLIFHGTFLLHLDISMVEKVLPLPSKQPNYRMSRSHTDFLMNLNRPPGSIKKALVKCWNATEPLTEIPFDQINDLVRDKYSRTEWNSKF